MKRVLLTGMSGTGKSTVIRRLADLGYKATDVDTDEWSHWVPVDGNEPFGSSGEPESIWHGQDWVWREDRIQRLLSIDDADLLFLGGTALNQGRFHPQFDHIILLTAPADVIIERLSTRTNNSYGKSSEELARVLEHVQTVEPLLRRAASLEVDTSVSIDQVVQTILQAVQT